MRANSLALSALLLGGLLSSTDALATPTQTYPTDQMAAAKAIPAGTLQLAGGRFGGAGASPGNKLNDKALVGKSGGRTGVGGTESVMFPTKPATSTAQTPPNTTQPKK
ncbi:MAG TPA: hypothetical protein VMQ73_15855 [Methylomirabilota bacterium]|nr:hypothetical protein [Methylomirabilota bacterium]